ncbi:DUF3579 domain-containing protein [Vitreoscilla filiformis]|uniref:DUF3579 domain-containing protein n=1 Tax=Vitreoscilla filiformis TaxID=63 RepID=UPI002FC66AC4
MTASVRTESGEGGAGIAALQQLRAHNSVSASQTPGTTPNRRQRLASLRPYHRAPPPENHCPFPLPMSVTKPREFFIQGLTSQGRTFRPSDWAERLAGVMSPFRPGGAKMGIGAHIGYSPYCVPRVINGVKCVIVSESLKALEPMAWEFVMNFARDNDLQVTEACLLPEPGEAPRR